jgi:membrane protein YdbS with pleckstrin-like domain
MLLWMPRRDYLAKKLRLDQLGIEIHSGVFWKRRQYVPRSRIQHTDVSQGPLQRRFELGAMTLHTAGTHNATIRIDGLSHTRANELRDQLVLPRDNAA